MSGIEKFIKQGLDAQATRRGAIQGAWEIVNGIMAAGRMPIVLPVRIATVSTKRPIVKDQIEQVSEFKLDPKLPKRLVATKKAYDFAKTAEGLFEYKGQNPYRLDWVDAEACLVFARNQRRLGLSDTLAFENVTRTNYCGEPEAKTLALLHAEQGQFDKASGVLFPEDKSRSKPMVYSYANPFWIEFGRLHVAQNISPEKVFDSFDKALKDERERRVKYSSTDELRDLFEYGVTGKIPPKFKERVEKRYQPSAAAPLFSMVGDFDYAWQMFDKQTDKYHPDKPYFEGSLEYMEKLIRAQMEQGLMDEAAHSCRKALNATLRTYDTCGRYIHHAPLIFNTLLTRIKGGSFGQVFEMLRMSSLSWKKQYNVGEGEVTKRYADIAVNQKSIGQDPSFAIEQAIKNYDLIFDVDYEWGRVDHIRVRNFEKAVTMLLSGGDPQVGNPVLAEMLILNSLKIRDAVFERYKDFYMWSEAVSPTIRVACELSRFYSNQGLTPDELTQLTQQEKNALRSFEDPEVSGAAFNLF